MNCFYYVDKPLNITSFFLVKLLRKILNTRVIGHTGTLDPLASGGVLLAVGNYTKLISYLENDKKTYEFTINLDGTTSSFDMAEKIDYISDLEKQKYSKELNKDKIKKILDSHFLGKISQIPPKYSAIKINGQRSYDLARAGIEFDMKKRELEIFSIDILEFNYPELKLRAEVSAGTYIRSIANDLGAIIGSGGYISYLRRTKVGNLDINLAQNIENFDIKNEVKIDDLFKNFVYLEKEIIDKLNNGMRIKSFFDFPKNVSLFVLNDEKIVTHIIEYDGNVLHPKKKII